MTDNNLASFVNKRWNEPQTPKQLTIYMHDRNPFEHRLMRESYLLLSHPLKISSKVENCQPHTKPQLLCFTHCAKEKPVR
jgi:hypothetical protein